MTNFCKHGLADTNPKTACRQCLNELQGERDALQEEVSLRRHGMLVEYAKLLAERDALADEVRNLDIELTRAYAGQSYPPADERKAMSALTLERLAEIEAAAAKSHNDMMDDALIAEVAKLRAERDALRIERNNWMQHAAVADVKKQKAEAERDALAALLRQLEFSANGYCPVCNGALENIRGPFAERYRHTKHCKINAALAGDKP